jgi:hypothetical protein
LSARAAKDRIKDAGVKIHRHKGRIWVDEAALREAKLPAHRNDGAKRRTR